MNQKFQFLCLTVKMSLLFCVLTQSILAQEFYVSPSGNNLNEGTKSKPLATISEAKERALNAIEVDKCPDVTIWLQGGVYQIKEPVVFEPFSLKDPGHSIYFKAEKGACPVVSGGIQLSGWTKKSNGFWEVELSGLKNTPPRELFINGQRAKRSRFPNEGYLRIKKVGEDKRTNFFFEENDFPVPSVVEDAELVVLHDWSISRNSIQNIDTEVNRLTTKDSVGAKNLDFFDLDHWEANPRYFLENAIEFLDENYEWVYNSTLNKIIVKFPDNINPNQIETVIPVSEGLIVFNGNENSPVKNIHFEGITFCCSAWGIPGEGYGGIQACHFDPRPEINGWAVVPAAIFARCSENCSFRNCTIRDTGGSGIWLGTRCKNNLIINSSFFDISGNGIMIGEGSGREINGEKWWQAEPQQVALKNTIQNCVVRDCGVQFYGAVGIWCGLTAETTIKNNEIYDLPYTGISIGWMWSTEPTPCRQNVIEGNYIHHIMGILSDGGGIYMLGLQPGSKIENNHIHDVKINAGQAESNGMFLDQGTTDIVVAGNLIYNIAKSPLRFHMATTNLVSNNFLFCRNGNPPIRYNTTNEEDIEKVNNYVFAEQDENYNEELNKAIGNWNVPNVRH